MKNFYFLMVLAMLCLGFGLSLACGDDDDDNDDNDSAAAAYCNNGCQRLADCGAFGSDSLFGADLSDCISGCENHFGESAQECAANCDYSAGCETWITCITDCSGAD
jgi:hypothetical protein